MYLTLFQRFDNCAVIVISKKSLKMINELLVYKAKSWIQNSSKSKNFPWCAMGYFSKGGGGGVILGYAPSKCSILAGGIYHRISSIRFETNWFNYFQSYNIFSSP